MESNKRILYIDLLKVLAILSIISLHIANWWDISHIYSFNWYFYHLFRIVGKFGVPLFLMITGVLFLNKKHDIKEFIKNRVSRILIPPFFWTIIILTCLLIVKFYLNSSFVGSTGIIFSNSLSRGFIFSFLNILFVYQNWYVWMILGVYLILPLLNEFVMNKGLKGVEYILIVCFITSIIYCVSKFMGFSLYYLDLTFFGGPLGFVTLGYYLHNKKFDISPTKMVYMGFILFLGSILIKFILTVTGLFNQELFTYVIFETNSPLFVDILTFSQVAGIFLIFKYIIYIYKYRYIISIRTMKFIQKIITSISKCSYGMYLNHYIFILIIFYILSLFNFNWLNHEAFLWIPVLSFIIFMMAWIPVLILSKISVLKKITGFH